MLKYIGILITYIKTAKRERYIKKLIQKGLRLGSGVSVVDSFFFDPAHCFLIEIGNNVTIAPNVTILAHDASTKNLVGKTKIAPVTIHSNAFIGANSTILPGVTIGEGSIVGAGSVVTKDVDELTVVAGNPAKPICSVDDYERSEQKNILTTTVFDKSYHINNVTPEKINEIRNEFKTRKFCYID